MQASDFLHTIAADPDNRELQMQYADWLEEHADPWAYVWRTFDFCGALNRRPEKINRRVVDDAGDDVGFSSAWLWRLDYFWYLSSMGMSEQAFSNCGGLYRSFDEAISDGNRAIAIAIADGWIPWHRGRLANDKPRAILPDDRRLEKAGDWLNCFGRYRTPDSIGWQEWNGTTDHGAQMKEEAFRRAGWKLEVPLFTDTAVSE